MLDKAAQNVLGGELTWVCDNDKAASKLLNYRCPGIPNLGDIKTVNWNEVPKVDILTAGFPCQPVSDAGQRKGTEDDRWLWPDIIGIIRDVRPELVVLENVAALLGRGFPEISGSLAEIGYDIKWTCVRASTVGAPHRRERFFAAAYPNSAGLQRAYSRAQPHDLTTEGLEPPGLQVAVNADRAGLPRAAGTELSVGQPAERHSDPDWWGEYAAAIKQWESILGRPAPFPVITRPKPGAVTTRVNPAFSEWLMGMPNGWVTDIPGLLIKRQLILVGNSVVPQQAEYALRELLTP